MRDLAKAVQNQSFQKQVRQSMQHVPSFKLDVNMPESMALKVLEVERALAAHEAKKGTR